MALQRASLSVVLVLAIVPSLLWTTGAAPLATMTGDPKTTSTELSTNQNAGMLEKDWTLTAHDLQELLELNVEVAGNVFVDYDASLSGTGVAAKVVIRSDSSDMLDLVSVDSVDSECIRLQYKNQEGHANGLVSTQIMLGGPHSVHSIKASQDVTLVLGDRVLVRNDPEAELHFAVHGDCRVLMGSSLDDGFSLNSLEISGSGDSLVQFETSSLRLANDLRVKMSGDSKVAVLASRRIEANSLESSTEGDGDLFVQTTDLEVQMLTTRVSGDGYVAYSSAGSCTKQHIHVTGDGRVAAGSIVCKDSEVKVTGEAEVLLQTTDSLTTSTMGDSSIRYVNERPKTVHSSGFHLHHGESDVKPAKHNTFKTYSAISPPSREPTKLAIIVRPSWFSDRPSVRIFSGDFEPFTTELQDVDFPVAGPAGGLEPIVLLGLVALVVVAVGTLHRRRAREQYQPLL